MNNRIDTDVNVKRDVLFPFDPDGNLESNFIKGEVHSATSTRVNIKYGKTKDYNLIVPQYPPFYTKDLVLKYKKNANSQIITLKENIDYTFGLDYKAATAHIGIPVKGCIILNTVDLDGVYWLDYRIVGGEHVSDRKFVLEKLLETMWNPREKDWIYVTNVPNLFPPIHHEIDWENVTHLEDLIEALDRIVAAVNANGEATNLRIDEYLSSFDQKEFRRLMEAMETHTYTSLLNEIKGYREQLREHELRQADIDTRLKNAGL